VRSLYGVAMEQRASRSMIATTSYFTKDAREFACKLKYQISLQDYRSLVDWLRAYPVSRDLRPRSR
jgi:restriction endonuclease Mrr